MKINEELQKRFDVSNGQMRPNYRYKNLNWYLGKISDINSPTLMEWFCYGDVDNNDIKRLIPLLGIGEALYLGWKDLGAYEGEFIPPMFQYNKVWLCLTKDGVLYDNREGVQPPLKDISNDY